MIGYKLFRLRKDGTIGPLFINKKQIIPIGEWLQAEDHPTKGFKHRPGWRVTSEKYAPHLSKKGRIWKKVDVYDTEELKRPKSQGGTWYIAKWLKVLD